MKTIDNETFKTYLNNQDYWLIMQSASKSFRKYIAKDDLKSCQWVGLFHAMRTYNNQIKFTSHLYNCVRWECLTYMKKNLRFEYSLLDNTLETPKQGMPFKELIANLSEIEQDVVTQYIMEQKTFKQIGNTIGKSHETARKHYNRAIDRLKEHFTTFLITKI